MSDFPGRFLVLDGVEGCGKSTQTSLLGEALAVRGYEVVLTHEPGGTEAGVRLRQILLHEDLSLSALTEAFLFCADRAEHVEKVIVPALTAGAVVVSDRFSAATFAYQVWAGGLAEEVFHALDGAARSGLGAAPGREGLHPDLTLILDLDPARGMERKTGEPGAIAADRIEARPSAYHQRVREGFQEYATRLGAAAVVLDADQPIEALHQQILLAVGLTA
jgi:dTMP kinase